MEDLELILRDAENREFIYDPRVNRYRYKDSGRLAPKQAIINLTRKRIRNTEKDLETITRMLFRDNMSLEDWQRSSAKNLKTLHLENRLIGAGGLNNITDEDYLQTGRTLKSEYRYLRRFAQDIKSGRITEKQAQNRIKAYAKKAQTSYWKAKNSKNQKPFMRRRLSSAEHCPECVQYARLGWQPSGTLPMPGEASSCLYNCQCSVEYADELPNTDSIDMAFQRFKSATGWIK